MDDRTQDAVETELQQRLLQNERIVTHPTFGSVKMHRPTPAQERKIAEVRRKQYQRDLMTSGEDAVLSKAQIEKQAIERGMWLPELTEQITLLTRKTGEAMGILDQIGFKSLEALLTDYANNVGELSALYPAEGEGSEVRGVIAAYYNLDEKPTMAQRSQIADAATSSSVEDLLEAGDTMRVQIEMLQEMGKVKKELSELHARQTKMFVDSLESRCDRAEEMARIYYCCKTAETGQPLWPSYEAMWDAESSDVEWLILEMHYFLSGVTEEFKDTLGKYGFIKRLSAKSDSSADSRAQPEPNSAGESQASPQPISSEAMASPTPQ